MTTTPVTIPGAAIAPVSAVVIVNFALPSTTTSTSATDTTLSTSTQAVVQQALTASKVTGFPTSITDSDTAVRLLATLLLNKLGVIDLSDSSTSGAAPAILS